MYNSVHVALAKKYSFSEYQVKAYSLDSSRFLLRFANNDFRENPSHRAEALAKDQILPGEVMSLDRVGMYIDTLALLQEIHSIPERLSIMAAFEAEVRSIK